MKEEYKTPEEKYCFMKKKFWKHPVLIGIGNYSKLKRYSKMEKSRLIEKFFN